MTTQPEPYVIEGVPMEQVCRECSGNGHCRRCRDSAAIRCLTCSGSGLELMAAGAEFLAFIDRHKGGVA